jgi:hypothetical protein
MVLYYQENEPATSHRMIFVVWQTELPIKAKTYEFHPLDIRVSLSGKNIRKCVILLNEL